MMKTLAFVAVAAMGLTACQNDFEEQIEAKDSVVVTFIADSAESRTAVDTTGEKPVFSWNDSGESFAVLEQSDELAEATNVTFEKNDDGLAEITAEFPSSSYKFVHKYATIYPKSGYVSAESINDVTLVLNPNQKMWSADTYDRNADLMVSKVNKYPGQPTATAQMLEFTRLAAVVKMSFKNFGVELGDEVESVTLTIDKKVLAGTITADLENLVKDGKHVFTPQEKHDSVTVETHPECNDVYFTVLPTTLAEGDTYTITVVTKNRLYIKQGAVPEGKSLEFKAGSVTRFSVNMLGVAPSDKWVLVKDASTLKQGDVVTIAAKNYDYVIGKQANNYPLASQTEVVKFGDYLYHPVATTATSVDNRIQHYTLMQRDANKVAFDFYNGVDYEGDTSVGFVWATGSNYAPKLQSFCDVNTLFDVTIAADGAATLCASEIEKSNKWWRYSHSTTASSRKFDMTTSVPTGNYQVCIYRLEGAVGTIPTVAAVVTVPDSDEPVVIAEEGAAEATAIDAVVFNYVGDWTITPTAADAWLNVAYDATNNCLTYTAEPNTGAKRETTVTITATLEGEEALTWSFKVIQKGAPQEITIAEFVKLAKDVNTMYKLTGKIATKPSSNTGDWILTDANDVKVTIKRLKTDGGDYAYDVVDLKVGDVMTVTAVPAGASSGLTYGGSSTYPAIYKGHYGFKTTLGVAADYTGGAVTIEVETYSNGSIVVPEAVEATMEANDFAEFSYSGGDTATVTFTSENTTSDAREATVTFTYGQASVTVIAQQGINPANKLGYELVTDASTLAVGDEVIIVAANTAKALACPTKTGDTKFPSVDIEKTGKVIYDAEKAGVQVFKLVAGEGDGTMAFEFTYKDTTYYPYYSSGLKMRTSVNAAASWSISIDETGDASISTISSSNTYLVKFNNAAASLTFTCYKSTANQATADANKVCIYKKQVKK